MAASQNTPDITIDHLDSGNEDTRVTRNQVR